MNPATLVASFSFIVDNHLNPLRRTRSCRHLHACRFVSDYLGCEALHLFVLRAELQEQQIDSSFLKFRNAFAELLRRAYQARTQTTIRYRVVFKRDALFELRVG